MILQIQPPCIPEIMERNAHPKPMTVAKKSGSTTGRAHTVR